MVDRNTLARATESTTSPTPGYLYNDIAKSAASSPSTSSEIATYLIRRLESKNNVNIKYKCLKTIQMVSSHPASRGMFKRCIVQDTNAVAAIKTCLGYRGPPDAVHGDTLYEKVRTQAKETLDAIYSDDPSSEQGGGMSGMGSSGFGSESYAAAGPSGYGGVGGNGGHGYNSGFANPSASSSMPPSSISSGPKKMEGIGNPMFADPRLNQRKDIGEMTVSDVISGVKEGFVGMIKDPLARNIPNVGGSSNPGGMGGVGNSTYGGPRPANGWSSAPPGQSQLAQSTNGAWTMASNRGPNAISSESYKAGSNNISSGVGGSWGASSSAPSLATQARFTAHNPTPMVNISGSTGGAKSDGTYERNLITELCPPGGMKAEPPPDKLQSFAQAIPNLNPDLICPALLDALEDGQPWIIRAKALCVMEVCINVAEDDVRSGRKENNAYADFFHACKEEIEPLAVHSRNAVRDPAKKVLKTLGLDVPQQSSGITSTSVKTVTATPAPSAAPNLLDFDEPVAQAPPEDVPPPPPTEVPPAPPASIPAGDMFGGMQMKSETAEAPIAPSPVAPPPQPVSDISTDLLGNVTASEPLTSTNVPSASGGNLFDEVSVKTAPATTVVPTIEKENVENAATAPSTSGFSFISGGARDVEDTEQFNPPKDTFDPLFGLDTTGETTPNLSSNPMQIHGTGLNPQMAAVVQQQQQQIMMMQAQMQQMQMNNSSRYMMMQQQQQQQQQGQMSNINVGTNSMMGGGPMKQGVMGAQNGSGVATSFAFMEDPSKAKKEATNKKFDFIQDAMKGAR